MRHPDRILIFISVLLLWFSLVCAPGAFTASTATPRCPSGEEWCERVRLGEGNETVYVTGNSSIDRVQNHFGPVLEANRKEFFAESGLVRGFGAGSGYAHIWLRDNATILPLSRYLYAREYLTSWLEEHLRYQGETGELLDWFVNRSPSGFRAIRVHEIFRGNLLGLEIIISGNKNTVEADQETSAVNAAYEICAITGDFSWLHEKIAGQEIIERLNRSLQFLLENRFSKDFALITSGMTADWGDVSPVYPDHRTVHLDEQTPIVVGLYTNAMFFSAASKLAQLCEQAGFGNRAVFWKSQAEQIKDKINAHLWMPEKGYYRLHRVDDPQNAEPHLISFDNSGIFAMGGNALCALFGIADARQATSIFRVADSRYRELGLSTVSAALMPPYPEGFFKLPVMRKPYSYQNGGQWDWFGSRLVLAEFEKGHEELAKRHLAEIAAKNVANGGLHEWHTPEGKGKGSPNYAGTAGMMAAAVFQGLFGIYMRAHELTLKIRLGEDPGAVRVFQPATGEYVSYHYHPDTHNGTVRLWYDSNVPGHGKLRLRIPQAHAVARVERDGKAVSFQVVRVGDSDFVEFSTDWKSHFVEVNLEKAQ